MKKLLLFPLLMLSTILYATDYNWEITPLIGFNLPKDNHLLDDSTIFGGELQYNGFGSKVKPEFQYLHTEAANIGSTGNTDITRIALNGVYDFDQIGEAIPLIKAGFGTEDRTSTGDGRFLDLGVGVKIPHDDELALKLEAIYMFNSGRNQENALVLLAGLNYAFGAKAQSIPASVDSDDDHDGVLNSIDKCPKTPTNKINSVNEEGCCLDSDDDKDGVLNSLDKCPTTPANTKVDSKGCTLPQDDDNDGVINAKDECPNTSPGKLVYNDGCPESLNLHVNFPNDSAVIEQGSYQRIKSYAKFLKEHASYSTDIIGYTSNTGNDEYNQKLSEQRAISVQKMIIGEGVPTSKVRAEGRGEANPIASNDTADGRASNRRIEAEITKDK
ncbi:OmpA family protein [Sulfurimonas sp.]|nr:OmpA family protein [Sulfurimonas sp.]